MDTTTFFGELLKQYGIYTTVAVIAIIYVLKDLWSKYIPSLFKKNKKQIALKDHSAFKDFDGFIEHTLKEEFTCECPIRKSIYRDILIERMKCFKEYLLEFVQTDLDDKEKYPTQYDFFLKISSILKEANAEARSNLIANGVPEFILDKLDKHRMQMKDVLEDMIRTISQSEYTYENNVERMRIILSTVVVFCKAYTDMVEEVLASFNGDIKTLNYHGTACVNCKTCIHDDYIKKMKANF